MMHLLLEFLLLIIGFVMLVKGADWFVDGAAGVAGKLGIPQLVIGLTIVAMGTSAPEAAISISSAVKGSADVAVGNVVGSNIMNILLILGITALITPLAVKETTVKYEIPFVLLVTVIFAVLGLSDGVLQLWDGIILWVLFLAYLGYLFVMTKAGKMESDEVPLSNNPWWMLLIFLVCGLGLVIWGSNITVDAATEIARSLGVSERIIALTIVAFGTSLPELFTCITAGIKKNADIAIGNIVGSNIFNILFVIGTSALVTSVPYDRAFLADSIAAAATAILLWVLVFNRNKQLKRYGGIIMLVAYAAYLVYTLKG